MKTRPVTVAVFAALLFLLQSCEERKAENTSDHKIGFKVLRFFREADPFFPDSAGVKTRPVFARIWYPANASDNTLDYSSYFTELNAEENYLKEDNQRVHAEMRWHRLISSFADLDSSHVTKVIDSLLLVKSNVHLNPDPLKTKYPLVVVAGGLPEYHLFLIEQIASKGFVVASIPRLGFSLGERLPFDADGAALLRDDMTHLVTELTKLGFVDGSQLFWVAWSYEGIPAITAATEFENTKALISFDASLGYTYGSSLLQDSVSFAATKISFPIVHFTGPAMDHGKSFGLLHALSQHSIVNVIKVPDMTHAQFTSITSVAVPSFSGHDAHAPYTNAADLVLLLLQESEITDESIRAVVSRDTSIQQLSDF
ncbi:MAG: hypothetical protein KDC99_16715 [Cyclobacteriaceae bacterium]|nr:hypothetical protein [Cyclobacteriaceae bacterium]